MTCQPETEKGLVAVLSKCTTLDEADFRLKIDFGIEHVSRRWALWDGWDGRPATTAGLISTNNLDTELGREIEADYNTAYICGHNLRHPEEELL